ncbi:hypothetical protein NA78x_001636 [Anatilimnocola sp. NA78]|uniref:hypothetical protein n=1 Tax=Anatilimnocola sp. NA78 TaxID=3415683 RepID=UPI003CE48A95
MPLRRLALAACCALVLTALVGCGGKFQPVAGQVVYPDGTPAKGLAGGQIIFQQGPGPDTASAPSANSPLDAEARFKLGTEQLGDGAALGTYQVAIIPPQAIGDVPLPRVIAAKFENFETSGLTQEVKQGGVKDLKITVELPK